MHPAALIEKALGHHYILARDHAQSAPPGPYIFDGLFGPAAIEAAFALGEPYRIACGVDFRAQPRNFVGKLARAAGGLAAPERNRRRGPVGVFHANAPRFHPPDAPGRCSEQEDVADQALDREVLIE